MATPGYSGKPLSQKLGLRQGIKIHLIDAPGDYHAWLGDVSSRLDFEEGINASPIEAAHLFCLTRDDLRKLLARLRSRLAADGFFWVSWPKKASKIQTEITEDVIRELALPLGFVDVKVCAVSEVWSGLKLVIRKSERIKT